MSLARKKAAAVVVLNIILEEFPNQAGEAKKLPQSNAIIANEAMSDDEAHSLAGLIKHVLVKVEFHLTSRVIWKLVRLIFPPPDVTRWQDGPRRLINVRVKAEHGVRVALQGASADVQLAAGFGGSEDEHAGCARRICTQLAAFSACTMVLATGAPPPEASTSAEQPAGGGASHRGGAGTPRLTLGVADPTLNRPTTLRLAVCMYIVYICVCVVYACV